MTDVIARLTAALSDRYTIERELGAGGMATVYLAEDLKHHRKVAVKVLRPELAAVLGAERFLKEIEVTANLQHPHILPLFDSGEADSFLYYVMPFVEGESLREKLDRVKQLSIDESIEITKAVASVLDYAHRHEVIHRDIKPENILLHDGQPVVADFGISLAVSAAGGTRLTETGLSLGTPQYMSPEQATGDREIDGRSDIYSLASVLYEMLAGDPPHTGSTVQAVIAKVVTDHPRLVNELRDTVPVHVAASVHKALAKLPADRFENAQSFAKALADTSYTLQTPTSVSPAAATKPWWTGEWPRKLGFAAALLIGIALGWVLKPTSETPARPVQFYIRSDSVHRVGSWDVPAISPDGSVVVYRGNVDGRNVLFRRRLGELLSHPIAGTEGATSPFFSPDGEWLGFLKDRMIMKTRMDGGTPITIAEGGSLVAGLIWGRDDRIVFSGAWPDFRVYEVSSKGGDPEPFVPLDTLRHTASVVQPQFLPGEDAILFTDLRDSITFWVLDIESGVARLLGSGAGAEYVESGHIVYARADGTLMLQPFDKTSLNTLGPPTSLEWATRSAFASWPMFDVSPSGALVVKLRGIERDLLHVDLDGAERQLLSGESVWVPRYSPDGSSIAYGDWAEGEGLHDLWLHDLNVGAETRLTFDALDANDPVWSPDGRYVAFSYPTEVKDLYAVSVEGGGEPTLLLAGEGARYPSDWSADGRYLVFTHSTSETGTDIWTLEFRADSVAQPFLATAFNEEAAVVSPDGQWLAYQSNETGRYEVYIQSFPEPGNKRLASMDGGVHPVWSLDGQALFFWEQDKLLRVRVIVSESLEFEDRQLITQNRDYFNEALHACYDVHPNGRELVIVTEPAEGELVVALDILGRER